MADRNAKPSADEAAYNFALVAYKHGLDQDTYTDRLLKVRNIGRNSLETETTKGTEIGVPDLAPTVAELDIPDNFANVVLWVGMRPEDAERYQAKQSRKTTAANEDDEETEPPTPGASVAPKKTGLSVSNINTPTVLESDPEALRVVLELKAGSGQRQFFVLVNPDADGLCDTYKIKKESVFFFKQFRDDNQGVVENRRTGWPKLAQQHVDRILNTGPETTTKKKKSSPQDIEVPAPMNLANDLASLAVLYDNTSRNGEKVGPLQQILDLLLAVDNGDARYAPPVQNAALCTILAITKAFSQEHARQAKEEIEAMWPALLELNITVQDMTSLGNALRAADLTIEHRLVRFFLVCFVDILHSTIQHPDEESCVLWAKEAHRLARLAVGSPDKEPREVKNRDFITYVDALTHTMKSLLKRMDLHTQALSKSQGSGAVPHDIDSIWERFKAKPDLDSAILAATSYHRYNVAQIMLRDKDISERLEKIVAQLEEMSVGLKELDDEEDD